MYPFVMHCYLEQINRFSWFLALRHIITNIKKLKMLIIRSAGYKGPTRGRSPTLRFVSLGTLKAGLCYFSNAILFDDFFVWLFWVENSLSVLEGIMKKLDLFLPHVWKLHCWLWIGERKYLKWYIYYES